MEIVNKDFKKAGVDFVAQNIVTNDFGDQVFKPYVMKEMNGVKVAVIGQAFPYTPIANPRYMVPDWSFGIREDGMQKWVDDARAKGAKVVVVISHNGMDVDLKMASRVTGIDAIFGGHTHDGVPVPVQVKNAKGITLVTNAGSNGKFLGVMDFEVKGNRVASYKYRLLPVFSNLLQADAKMDAFIKKVRAPYESKLNEKLAVSDDFLYRRGNFNGTWDQVLVDALMAVKGADAAFSPGFRWGTTLLPGEAITMERLMDQTAITYPQTTLNNMTGETIKTIMEDVCDNLFNPDPYYQQGGDMVRVGGIEYTVDPTKAIGHRISNMTLKGKPVDAKKTYKVAGWAPVGEGVTGTPVWDVVAEYLRDKKVIKGVKLNTPKIVGIGKDNAGIENYDGVLV
jgi:sulfur-oxidizing protein SoxB